MKKKSKRYKNLKETYKKKDSNKFDQVLKELKNGSGVKFVESIDISMNINLKKIKGADNNLRTLIELPHGNGKKIRVGLLCDENKLAEARTLQEKLMPLHMSLFVETSPAPVKYAASLRGISSAELRLPLVEPNNNTKNIVELALTDLKLSKIEI